MLGSNQRPLRCEGSATVCWRFPEFAKLLQIVSFLRRPFSQVFRRFTFLVAADSIFGLFIGLMVESL